MICSPATRSLLAASALLSASALAKPWNGIDPGVSHRDDVVKRFGQPSKTLTVAEGSLAYTESAAIREARRPSSGSIGTGLVERIDVFPR